MAQETVIHRIDAELGDGAPFAPVPDDLAIDGIDELLRIFVAYSRGRVWRLLHGVLAGRQAGRTGCAPMVRRGWCGPGRGLFTVDDAAGSRWTGHPPRST